MAISCTRRNVSTRTTAPDDSAQPFLAPTARERRASASARVYLGSAHLGLPATTLVVQGGVDALIAMVGLGVAQPGQLALITGSSHLQFGVLADDGIALPGLWGAYPEGLYPGRSLIEGGQTSTGSIIPPEVA